MKEQIKKMIEEKTIGKNFIAVSELEKIIELIEVATIASAKAIIEPALEKHKEFLQQIIGQLK